MVGTLKLKVLFLCTGNTCRSQMAEGWARQLRSDALEAYSAGSAIKDRVDPRAVAVMAEAGVDLAAHFPKTVQNLAGITFDYVVTLCGDAAESCPFFPGPAVVLHRGFDDPPRLAADAASEAEALAPYRRVRDEIKTFILDLPEWFEKQNTTPSRLY